MKTSLEAKMVNSRIANFAYRSMGEPKRVFIGDILATIEERYHSIRETRTSTSPSRIHKLLLREVEI